MEGVAMKHAITAAPTSSARREDDMLKAVGQPTEPSGRGGECVSQFECRVLPDNDGHYT